MVKKSMVKHVFILNPVAGKSADKAGLHERIEQACADRGVDFEIHYTSARGEATEYVRALCEQYPDTQLRFMLAAAMAL